MVAVSAFGLVAQVSADPTQVSVTQTASATTVEPGGSIEFTVNVDATDNNAPGLQANLPDGWTITQQGATGAATFKDSTNEWVWLSGGTQSVTYTVQVPSDASGEFTVSSDLSAINPNNDNFVSDSASTTITVSEPATPTPTPEPATPTPTPEPATPTPTPEPATPTPTPEPATPTPTPEPATPTPTPTPGPDGPQTTVSLSPSEGTVGVGDSTTYDVVVDSASGGVGSIDLTVSTDDASVAAISNIEAAGDTQYVDDDVLADGTSATIDTIGLDTAQSGPVTVATVTVTGVSADGTSAATTDLSVDVSSLGTEAGADYEVTGTSGATVTVQPAEFLVSDLNAPDSVVRGEPVTVTADVTNDGSITTTKTVEFRFDLNGDGTLSEDETVDTVQLELEPGETEEVSLTAVVPEDTPLGEYDHGVFTVDDSESATIDVTLAKLDSTYQGPPQDLDGDGLYEDVNGDGSVTLSDVQAFFINRDSAVIQENGELFDFNGNGEFNNVDIQKFFATVSENN
jgi:hypothetical protein